MPLVTATAYLFVTPDQAKWDPWWLELYQYLSGLASADLEWKFEPVQEKYFARPALADRQRKEIMAFLRTAPEEQVEQRRTLKRAIALSPEQQARLDLMFFSSDSADE